MAGRSTRSSGFMTEVRQREIFSTPRLIVRTTLEPDIGQLHEKVFSDVDVTRFVFSGRTFSREDSAKFIRERFNFSGDDVGLSTLVERATGEVIGFCGLRLCIVLAANDLELSFVLARNAWGKGYASEIGQAQIDFGLGHLGRKRLLALAHPANTRSINVIVKLGMRYVEGKADRHVYSIEA
jgi:[ribosomal protein S5]-alanine N-acetyltransferase